VAQNHDCSEQAPQNGAAIGIGLLGLNHTLSSNLTARLIYLGWVVE